MTPIPIKPILRELSLLKAKKIANNAQIHPKINHTKSAMKQVIIPHTYPC